MRSFTNRQASFTLEGRTVNEVLQALVKECPDTEKALFDEEKNIRSFVDIYVNDRDIKELIGLQTAVADGDEILLLPVIAGGVPTESIIPDDRRKEAALDDKEIDRYGKHLLLREIGVKGQKRIKAARVLIVGAGALGSPVAIYLASAGVGTLGIADAGEVELSDLQSQILHGTRDVNRPKTASAKDAIKKINPLVTVQIYSDELNTENIKSIIDEYDVVVDAANQFTLRYLLSDACVFCGKPLVSGAIYQLEGRVTIYDAAKGPCMRCQFPSPPPVGLVPSCAEGGVIAALPGIVGSTMANEVLKLLIGGGETLIGKMWVCDVWNNRSRTIRVEKDSDCPICGSNPSIVDIEEFDYADFCGLHQEDEEASVEGIEPEELARRIDRGDSMTIVDVREPHERAVVRFPNAIVIPIGQLARRQKELDPDIDTIFICREGKRSILAINTLREAGYQGPMYNLKGGMEAAKDIILSHEGAWL